MMSAFFRQGTRFALNICEDTWFPEMPAKARAAGAEVLLVPNASPYHMNKQHLRQEVMREHVSLQGLSLVYANLCGAQDELIFDGASFVLNARGEMCAQLPSFEEALAIIAFEGAEPQSQPLSPALSVEAQVYAALVTGVRDYVGKNGFPVPSSVSQVALILRSRWRSPSMPLVQTRCVRS